MPTRVTVLCNDKVELFSPYIGEHGFACFIETDHGNYLFDTGQGFGIIHNALYLEKNLKSIEGIILSHGHYDHTSGLDKVLKVTGSKKVYAHPGIFAKKYDNKDGEIEYTGLRYVYEYLTNLGADFILNREFSEIGKGIYLTGEVPRKSNFEKTLNTQFIIENNKKLSDPLMDDNSLAIDTEKGLVVILGCAHAGIINILDYFSAKLNKHIYAVIGGTHLHPVNDGRLQKTIKALRNYGLEHIGTSHCTGSKETDISIAFKKEYFDASVGAQLYI
jgi:7,8-dihydropterin-6-yl-methyl-4-(beta-D-ribofuranosyl)aminobenzene 5'-phosphate synthase